MLIPMEPCFLPGTFGTQSLPAEAPSGVFHSRHQMTLARQKKACLPAEVSLLISPLSGLKRTAISQGPTLCSRGFLTMGASHRAASEAGPCLPARYNRPVLPSTLQQLQRLRAQVASVPAKEPITPAPNVAPMAQSLGLCSRGFSPTSPCGAKHMSRVLATTVCYSWGPRTTAPIAGRCNRHTRQLSTQALIYVWQL